MVYGNSSSAAVLGAAFSGVSATNAQFAGGGSSAAFGGTPSIAADGGMGLRYQTAGTSGTGMLDPNANVVPGSDGMSQMDLINTMNQNNLQLLELQAVMQNNMQSWNTKSNILSADHRARMAMIEKFTARG